MSLRIWLGKVFGNWYLALTMAGARGAADPPGRRQGLGYRSEIDGLRAIAVMAVIIAHTGLGWLPGGYAGVDAFFVISGFLITGIIQRDLAKGTFRFRDFYARRVRRIFPVLFVVLGVTTVLAWWLLLPSELHDYSASVFFTVLFLSNGYFIDFVDYFAPSAEVIPLLHTWSLAVEEQFYILFPAVAWLAWRLGGKRAMWAAVVLLAILSFALAEWGWRNEPRANYFFSPSRFWEILLGGLLAMALQGRERVEHGGLAALGLGMLFLSFAIYDAATPFPSIYTLLPTVGTGLVLAFAPSQGAVSRFLMAPVMRGIGLISFSAYLWHQPVFVFARLQGLETGHVGVAVPLVALVLGLSYLSWRFVEQPLRHPVPTLQVIARWRSPGLAVAAAALLGVSVLGYVSDLPLKRHDAQDRALLMVTRQDARDYNHDIKKGFDRRAFLTGGDAPKVAMVGDSFGRDFLNVLEETGVLEQLDLSLWTIGHTCAPFFLKEEDARIRDILSQPHCDKYDRYESAALLESLRGADRILLVSKWTDWHVPYVAETLKNIREISNAPIVLVGPKHFGDFGPRAILRVAPTERAALRVTIEADKVAANRGLRTMEGVAYVDIIETVCGPEALCPVVAEDGKLVTPDGGHLTQAGAALVGQALMKAYDLPALLGVR